MIVVKLWESLATLVGLQASLNLAALFPQVGWGWYGHLFIANQN